MAARLPLKFRDYIRVDGEQLPPRKIIGDLFEEVKQQREIGPISIGLYHPEKRFPEDDLRLTSAEVGEVPMTNFYRVLRGDIRLKMPPVFLVPEVCGTISAPYLRQYANEDRATLNPAVADDPRTLVFLNFLRDIAPIVEQRLKIRIRSSQMSSDDEGIQKLAARCNQRYNPKGIRPDINTQTGKSDGNGDSDPSPPSANPPGPLQLILIRKEFEVGERIEIKVARGEGFPEDAELEWNTDFARASDIKLTPSGGTMYASDIGSARIIADVPGTPLNAMTRYQVVRERAFRLSIPYAEITLGAELPLMGVNLDKLKGKISWKLDGVGHLEPQGGRATYLAITTGVAQVRAFDSGNSAVKAVCDITVTAKRGKLICIRGQFFDYDCYGIEKTGEFARPVTMIAGDTIHHIAFNINGRGYQAALRTDSIEPFMVQAVAMEFARFQYLVLKPQEIEARDIPTLLDQIALDGYTIFGELIEGNS